MEDSTFHRQDKILPNASEILPGFDRPEQRRSGTWYAVYGLDWTISCLDVSDLV